MKRTGWIALLFVLASGLIFPTAARADGIIIPEPPICDPGPCPPPVPPISQLAVRYHHVTVKIQDQVAITHVDQVFYNPNNWTVEGTYLFPLPQDAVVTSFQLWIDGKLVNGSVLDAEQARRKYEEIVRSLRDPALLEYAGRGAVQAQIFPIPAGTERRVELEYTQALVADHGLVRYIYPLNTEKFSAEPLENVSINVEISSTSALRAVYSPSHSISVVRKDDHTASAGFEADQVLPDSDFSLFYSLGETPAFHLLTYRDPFNPHDPDGFFVALIAPSPEASAAPQPKDILLVLDHSGSMDGAKIQQARQAADFILSHLNAPDRFNIISFSTAVESYAPALRPANEAPQALRWVDKISAAGSTDINRALLEAAAMTHPERPTYLIFLTDGLPTQDVIDSAVILDNFNKAAPTNLRLFAFGVGYDVDTFLLDSLAQAHHGASSYVLPEQTIDEVVSGFYEKISTPVLTDLSLDFGSISTSDIYPAPLPDLFRGSQIIAVGRYREGGVSDVTLRGQLNGTGQSLSFPEQVFTVDNHAETGPLAALPRLWATRKIGYLLNQVRLQGATQEIIDQIVRLSIRYGIVTPYTSYLVTEPGALGSAAQHEIAQNQYNALQALPAAPASGQKAVQDAAGQGALAEAESAPQASVDMIGRVRLIGSRTFVLQDGKWIDTSFDPESMTTLKLAFLSEDYFAFLQAHPDLATAIALGEQVIVVTGGQAYETTASPVSQPPAAGSPQPTALPRRTPTPIAIQPMASSTAVAAVHTPLPALSTQPAPALTPSAPTPNPTLAFPCISGAVILLFLALFYLARQQSN